MVLILRVNKPNELRNLWPISLYYVIYKIVTKVIASRLKTCLPSIISSFQSAFVPRRQIFDNILVTCETLHSLARKKSGNRGQMTMKLDMSKVYDRVEWPFLKSVMIKMNFPQNRINLIMDCISSANLSFLLNGRLVCYVSSSRGLMQGCLLSPYMFFLCADTFSCLVSKFERGGRILGFKCARGVPLISYLMFADNNILFYKASNASDSHICNILGIYERASGQQINM
ncbi:hypothetical protein Dsin_024827 [Dipteronia sinensis]|uniref:Reverse transcriptase domain-containing protein n=1 Tax=Dipteronia sinensis TaxID=43782 RepID=A0AAE0DWD9_9ROSI|nr:hypothetical protein Dsin_024827 [Dipteronia sinensis]